MRVIIFNDTQNFNGSLNFLNERFKKGQKRFWDYKKYIPFLIKKIRVIDGLNKEDFQLVKSYFYEGRYSSNLIKNLGWSCNQKIRELNNRIKKEHDLLNQISQEKLSKYIRGKINRHVEEIKKQLEDKKKQYLSYIEKQKRNFEGQKGMIKELESNPLIELKTTPLKQREGEIYQKGVDVLLSSDLINLAHLNAYDLAIILSGDTDLIEAVRLIKTLGKIPIVFSYHVPGNPEKSNISDLAHAAKFINIKDFTNTEIYEISEARKVS